jgi:hypothetical protein
MQTKLEGVCAYHPGYQPKPYSTAYARGAQQAAAR